MTKSILLRGAVLFLAAVSPVVVCTQFQQPNNEELKMTADPEAPGAPAVYLDNQEVTIDPQHCLENLCPDQPGQFTSRQTLLTGFTFAKPEEYQDLRAFYQKVAAVDQEQLVLTMPSTSAPERKGN